MRVVITGIGVVSCLGNNVTTAGDSLRRGRSGIVVDPERVELGFRSALTGKIDNYDARAFVNRKQARTMGQPAQFAVGAAFEAIQTAGLDGDAFRDPACGLIVGNDSCAKPAVDSAALVREHKGTRILGSGRIIQVMNSTVSINLATVFGVQGAAWTVSGACASGAHALGQAYMLISSGIQDRVLCGGAQEINWEAMASFDALGGFATGDPKTACRPFDTERTGLVPSGGAAMLVLESLERAQQRDAEVLAEVWGYAFSSDGEHVTQPNGLGAQRAIRMALERAQCPPGEVEYVNAHATGTPVGDIAEGRALLEIFGKHGPPISSTKSMTGHECWMAGASEVVYSVLMMRDGFIAPNLNLTKIEEELEGLDVVTTTREQRPRVVLSNSFGFGGTNAAILLRAFDG